MASVSILLLAAQLAMKLSSTSLTGGEQWKSLDTLSKLTRSYVDPDRLDTFFDRMTTQVRDQMGNALGSQKDAVLTSLAACRITATYDTRQSLSVVNVANVNGDGKYFVWLYHFRKAGKDIYCEHVTVRFNVQLDKPYTLVHNRHDSFFGSTEVTEKIEFDDVVTVNVMVMNIAWAIRPFIDGEIEAPSVLLNGLKEGAKQLDKDAFQNQSQEAQAVADQSRSEQKKLGSQRCGFELKLRYNLEQEANTDWEFVYY